MPLASSIIKSWNLRWHRYAPSDLAEAVDLNASRAVVSVSSFDGRTAEWHLKRRPTAGFVGSLTLSNDEVGSRRHDVGCGLLRLLRSPGLLAPGRRPRPGLV